MIGVLGVREKSDQAARKETTFARKMCGHTIPHQKTGFKVLARARWVAVRMPESTRMPSEP